MLHAGDGAANGHRSAQEVFRFERAGETDFTDPMRSCASRASALRAVGVAAKNAGFDAGTEIGRVVFRETREGTVFW